MKIKKWQHAEQIISQGKQILDRILLEYVDERWCMISASERNWRIEWWIPFEEKYFKTQFLPLTLEIASDMKQAKEYIGLNTRVEDKILELK